MLQDRFQRVHDYLRISLTDSCNFRCTYCMPEENIQCMPNAHLMQPDEIETIAKIFVSLGVKKIRLTGGEPMVRKEFAEIVERLAKLPVELTLTTNGVLVHQYLGLFKKAGIRSLNVSLDSLKQETFFKLTKRDKFQQVWDNIELLLKHDFRIKINVVALNGIIENELLDFVKITKQLPLHVRFIEFMPFAGNLWDSSKVLTAQKMLDMVKEEFDVVKLKDEPHATAKKYKAIGHEGTFAFITTMSEHFCGSCNRMRITADGKMKNCLFGKEEMDLLGTLRAGKEIEPLIRLSLYNKHAALGGQFSPDYQKAEADKIENRSMIKIGG
ncbi:GTP 3',8-cyclase MoaA [Arthrospiribacter ruber]|uniref:GTP 3',8-cyclase n=1 Tax=Arthrospiribacter ruber TaxID=2487934 RepID=A0A951J1M6_9BACT|nr:GTP 3',8-cyclase MoaA [Arthrospiribacter ruber]MBW3469807.1 GTP 3',8-cyclase MoaA [Arthrospiribacter ruber]